jgi:transketolase
LGDIGVFGFNEELKTLPLRAYNIGILEQSTISVAAGLSRGGLIPFVHTIAPFMVERALEQLKVDFGYQKLNGNFISVGGSYDYAALGCTHHCPADVSLLLTIPNMEIFIPGTANELDSLIEQTYKTKNPTYIRMSEHQHEYSMDVVAGKSNIMKKGNKATVVCFGPMLQQVMEATINMDVTVLYYSSVFPFDAMTLLENFNETIIICEPFYEGTTNHLINNSLSKEKYRLINIGVPRKFLTNYGKKIQHDLFLRLDSRGIHERIQECL